MVPERVGGGGCDSGAAVKWVLAIALVVGLIARFTPSTPTRCGLCGNTIRRKYYTWPVGEETKAVCPECNSTLRRKQSKAALR